MNAYDDNLLLQAVQMTANGYLLSAYVDDVYTLASIRDSDDRRRYCSIVAKRIGCHRHYLRDLVESARDRYLSLRGAIRLGSGPSLEKARAI